MKLNKNVKVMKDSFDSFSTHCTPKADNFRADLPQVEKVTMGLEVFD